VLDGMLIFVCQLAYVFLLGIQSRNVRDGQIASAAAVSTLLGLGGLYMTSAIARAAVSGGNPFLAVCYVAAGPIGICSAILLHDRLRKCD